MSEKDGGAAFPRAMDEGSNGHNGMTLRDWFAGMALQGLLADPSGAGEWDTPEAFREHCGTLCYAYADAMLLARKEKSDEQ